jgi:hypothetical protein
MKFMLLFGADEAAWGALSSEERDDAIARIGAWFGRHAGAGAITQGARFSPGASATTVRLGPAGRSGTPQIVSGPMFESRETIGSYAIVEVPDAEAAVAIAASWPAGGSVEVRPLAE